MSVMTTRTLTTLTAAVALAASGCGGAGAGAGAGIGRSDDQAELDFARCMREHGIEMPDPTPAGGTRRREFKVGGDMSPQRLRGATVECREKTGGGPHEPTAEEKERFRDAALKFARCMRQHGADVPDPRADGA